jgi:hypothetical protein
VEVQCIAVNRAGADLCGCLVLVVLVPQRVGGVCGVHYLRQLRTQPLHLEGEGGGRVPVNHNAPPVPPPPVRTCASFSTRTPSMKPSRSYAASCSAVRLYLATASAVMGHVLAVG